MTRKTWTLLLGTFAVPALFVAACSSETDDADDDHGAGDSTNNSSTGSTKSSTTGRTGVGSSNTGGRTGRFTGPSTTGGVLHRGGASAGGRTNQFNTGGAVSRAGAGNLAGSANAGAAGLGIAGSGGASTTASSTPNGGTTGTGGSSSLGVAGAAGSAAICPDGCAAMSISLSNGSSASYSFLAPSSVDFADASVTFSANVYAPGASAGRVRLLVENATGSDACRSAWVNLSTLASQFTLIGETTAGCVINDAAKVSIRFDNNSGSDQSLKIYITSLTLTSATPPTSLGWNATTGSASIDSAPDTNVLGPDGANAGSTLSYLND